MAEKRCFSKAVIDTDAFYDLSPIAQLLYFHLELNTDDWGVISSPRKLMRLIGAADSDLEALIAAGFILRLESGAVVVTHFNVHNTLRRNRIRLTTYCDELEKLTIDDAGLYRLRSDGELSAVCQTIDSSASGNGMPKRREGKRTEQKRIEGNSTEDNTVADAPPPRSAYGEYRNVLLSDEEFAKLREELGDSCEKLINKLSSYMVSTGKTYKSHYAVIRRWFSEDRAKALQQPSQATHTQGRDTRSIFEVIKNDNNA